jgi:hypothetical protein
MVLAGTIIFGGGPVVIPLLRDYVVVPGESVLVMEIVAKLICRMGQLEGFFAYLCHTVSIYIISSSKSTPIC